VAAFAVPEVGGCGAAARAAQVRFPFRRCPIRLKGGWRFSRDRPGHLDGRSTSGTRNKPAGAPGRASPPGRLSTPSAAGRPACGGRADQSRRSTATRPELLETKEVDLRHVQGGDRRPSGRSGGRGGPDGACWATTRSLSMVLNVDRYPLLDGAPARVCVAIVRVIIVFLMGFLLFFAGYL